MVPRHDPGEAKVNGKAALVLTSVLGASSGNAGDAATGRHHASQDDLERFFDAVDRNNDGFLTLEELAEDFGVSRTCLPRHLAPAKALERMSKRADPSLQADFDSADRNGDGRLSFGELQRAVHEPAALLRGR
jgi:Ca2+-binding EF-hand superfamily protein